MRVSTERWEVKEGMEGFKNIDFPVVDMNLHKNFTDAAQKRLPALNK